MYKLYTDGSSDYKKGEYSSAFIILNDSDDIVYFDYIKGDKESLVRYNNVSGEVMACLHGLKACNDIGVEQIVIHYDYEGLEKWENGSWQARNPLSQMYIQALRHFKRSININFCKVVAHSGDQYNELCDILAKRALGKTASVSKDIKELSEKLLTENRKGCLLLRK